MSEFDHKVNHEDYEKNRYGWRQSRDCVSGSDEIKRGNEIYLPIPSGMLFNDSPASLGDNNSNKTRGTGDFSKTSLPWWHDNPAYRAYLQRAKFPEISSNTLRGLTGISTKQEPMFKLAHNVSYLEENATPEGLSLIELYEFVVSEIFQTGKISLVVDVKENGEFFIAPYSAESNINWKIENYDGEKVQTNGTFVEKNGNDDENCSYLVYSFDEAGLATYQKFKGDQEDKEKTPIMRQGKTLKRLPIVNIGSINNSPKPDPIPLKGVNEISISIYQKDADLSQAQFLTCNPTLFLFGIQPNEVPKVVGSSVVIGVSNPNAHAEYPSTDTSALDHVEQTKKNLFEEAIYYGASLVGPSKKGVESADSLALREAASGASLITVVRQAYKGIQRALDIIEELGGGKSEFVGATDFAEHSLTPQGLNALVSSWVQGAISHDTVLNNFREANIISNQTTNEEEKNKIKIEEEDKTIVDEEGDEEKDKTEKENVKDSDDNKDDD